MAQFKSGLTAIPGRRAATELGTQPVLVVIDDEPAVLDVVRPFAEKVGFRVTTCAGGADGLAWIKTHAADVVLVDVRMPGVNGLDVLREIKATSPRCEVILMTGYAAVDSAVEAIKLGAYDYLTKPFDFDRLRHLLADRQRQAQSRRSLMAADVAVAEELEFCGMIGRSAAMQAVFQLIRRLAPHVQTALVSGETGTGKELVARALHLTGPRASKRFITINCSAVVETLFESELFGHVRGAFTGASEAKAGLIEIADGGTLFLDEIGEMPAPIQAKLLRVLEQREVQRVGALEPRRVDVSIIAATNRNLTTEAAAGRFRRDLLYRLNVVELHLPPLRERREDILYLVSSFVRQNARRLGKPLTGVSLEAEQRLCAAAWPGNVRELRNVIERASMLADTDLITERELAGGGGAAPLRAADLGNQGAERGSLDQDRSDRDEHENHQAGDHSLEHPGAGSGLPDGSLRRLERDRIVDALEKTHGNKLAAARVLGVSRRALYRRLDRHGLRDGREAPPIKPVPATPGDPDGA